MLNGRQDLIPNVQYTDVGPIVDGIAQLVPEDGWYWLRVGLGPRCQWHICYIEDFWIKTLIEVWNWNSPDFHERHRIGPRLEPPGPGAPPFIRSRDQWEH